MAQADKVINLASNKVRYSMLNKVIEKDLIPYCLERKKSVLAYNVLQRGILTGREMKKFLFRKEANSREPAFYEPGNMKRINIFLDAIRPIAMDNGATLTQLCIRWAIDRPGVTCVLLGATNPGQVIDDAKAIEINLLQEDMDTIDCLLADLENDLVLI
jgi:aryl-alcohol dehydrogenase-like predicted oxidoreductase